jgi:hypothetical protein
MILNYVLEELGFIQTEGFTDSDETINDILVESWTYQVSDAKLEADNLYRKNEAGNWFLKEQSFSIAIAGNHHILPGKAHTAQISWLKRTLFGNKSNQALKKCTNE